MRVLVCSVRKTLRHNGVIWLFVVTKPIYECAMTRSMLKVETAGAEEGSNSDLVNGKRFICDEVNGI